MSEEAEVKPQEQPAEQEQMTREKAINIVLEKALTRGCAVKGIAEVCKALEAKKVKWVFLADDCDNDEYKNLIKALAKQNNVPVIPVEAWIKLKDACKIGINSEEINRIAQSKGKEAKIKPRCSSCAIIDFGEETEAFHFLEKEIQ